MPPLIEAALPGTWQELEDQVAQILRECGYDVEVQKEVELAGRGRANIDVWADDHSSPRNVLAIECKQWRRRTNQSVVHAFRTVVGDSGGNTGLIVSSAGFQRGAIEAAAYSNVRLLDWNEFQEMFAARWFRDYLSPTLAAATDALHEYTEPINSRIFRKADALPEDRQERFKLLREQHFPLAATNFLFHPVVLQHLLPDDASPLPTLPLRRSPELPQLREMEGRLPDDVLDATALRPMMKAMIHNSQVAIAEFDEVFGERA